MVRISSIVGACGKAVGGHVQASAHTICMKTFRIVTVTPERPRPPARARRSLQSTTLARASEWGVLLECIGSSAREMVTVVGECLFHCVDLANCCAIFARKADSFFAHGP